MSTLIINETTQIPLDELVFSAVRSSGPGGQNVNKVNTKVQLQWNVAESAALSNEVRERLLRRAGTLVSKTGWLTITSQTSRRQRVNRDDCLRKLRVMILDATKSPKPRKPTKPTKASRLRRRRYKELTARKKKLRRGPNIES